MDIRHHGFGGVLFEGILNFCDVFFCTNPQADAKRRKMAELCREFWPDNTTMLFVSDHENFQFEHCVNSEKMCLTPIYCHADDDCIPLGKDFLELALAIMESRPEYGIIAFNDHYMWEKEWKHLVPDPDVFDHHSVGGIYLIRRGILKPDQTLFRWDDAAMCDQIIKKGYKVGRFRNIFFNHIGFGFSTCFPKRTGRTQVSEV